MTRTSIRLRPSKFIVSGKDPETLAIAACTRDTAEQAAAAALALKHRGYIEIVTVQT